MRRVVRRSIAVMLSLSVFSTQFLGCGSEPQDSGSAPADVQPSKGFDGKTLFKGMFLGIGPAARAFPEVWQHPMVVSRVKEAKQTPEEVERHSEQLLARIEKLDPTFFERLGRDIQSGDHVAIQAMLAETKETLRAAMEQQKKEQPTEGAPAEGKDPVEATLTAAKLTDYIYRFEYVAVDMYGVAWVAVVIVVIDFNVAPTGGIDSNSSLNEDSWVDMLANRDFACLAADGSCTSR